MVELTRDLPEQGLRAGDQGTVVLVHQPGVFEVEFASPLAEVEQLVALKAAELRLVWSAPA